MKREQEKGVFFRVNNIFIKDKVVERKTRNWEMKPHCCFSSLTSCATSLFPCQILDVLPKEVPYAGPLC